MLTVSAPQEDEGERTLGREISSHSHAMSFSVLRTSSWAHSSLTILALGRPKELPGAWLEHW